MSAHIESLQISKENVELEIEGLVEQIDTLPPAPEGEERRKELEVKLLNAWRNLKEIEAAIKAG